MVTVVNNPPASNDSNGGAVGMIVGFILLIVVAYAFVVYGLPALRQMGSPQINIPNKIDVNVNQTK